MTALDLPTVIRPAGLSVLLQNAPATRLLDVRTPAEYDSAHIAGAYNVPLDTLGEHAAEIRSVTEPIVLVCQSGGRARKAEEALRAAGMSNLHVLDGGMNGWIAEGQAVRRGVPNLSLERQVRIVAGTLAATGGLLALLVNPLFALLPAFVGSGLVFAGITDTCGMALALTKLPYNRAAGCDVEAMVRALTTGETPHRVRRERTRAPASTAACARG
ncbi:MAG TPA: rhodanese-like domain-containing protein [Gemmatimonadales bacterium]|nr:rhodanese-like domain-containing protein [Gemmatimonadales bacterium]